MLFLYLCHPQILKLFFNFSAVDWDKSKLFVFSWLLLNFSYVSSVTYLFISCTHFLLDCFTLFLFSVSDFVRAPLWYRYYPFVCHLCSVSFQSSVNLLTLNLMIQKVFNSQVFRYLYILFYNFGFSLALKRFPQF